LQDNMKAHAIVFINFISKLIWKYQIQYVIINLSNVIII